MENNWSVTGMEGNSYISLNEELAREVEEKLPPEEEMQNLAEF